jgi:hypothetical protein
LVVISHLKNLSMHPPPGGHRPSIIFPLDSLLHTGNFQIFFPFGFFPLSLIFHFPDNPDLYHQPSTRNSNRLSLSPTHPFNFIFIKAINVYLIYKMFPDIGTELFYSVFGLRHKLGVQMPYMPHLIINFQCHIHSRAFCFLGHPS